ncbi:hypothetical protein CONPUDRAFT_81516 [Coniophora puteana RWD-64-598 SS2]|uniref:Uncharacterized protein n=1 Tax=Coniophora puteana (strain RWD-64-598) TaxID=741705 RepID=A0A5M3MRP2_CONPW|nr:uncharacterized protein CONPUDRAFT_81516 [Coniophora puteana RWD-64-598 SS2]EIW81819.1 hypothetical protein CONPUDRAFT_81516 [Coniophora puteana RWD-64-598 SS2]
MFPKVVALSLDWTFWQGEFDSNKFGKGPGAVCPAENNLELESEFKIRDKSDHSRTITMYSDVPMIINDLMRNNAFLAIVSRSKSKALCDRALHLFKAVDPTPWSKKLNQKRPIADLVAYNHIYDEEKTVHFHKIWANTGIEYSDMVRR